MNWYYCPQAGRIKAHRCTLAERFRMWKRRRERMKTLTY